MSGGGQQQAPTQTTKYELSPEQRELMNLAMPGVREFAAKVPERFQGSTVAGFDPSQVAGQEKALGAAGTQAQLASGGAGTTGYWLSPDALDVQNNPTVRSSIDAATRPIFENLTRTALPAIRSSSQQTGNFGGSRQGIAEGLAIQGAESAAGDAGARIASDAYSQNVKAQLQALGLLPQTQQAQLSDATTTSGVGDVRQGQAQRLLDEEVGNFNYDQTAPFLQSKEIISLLQGLPGGSTVTTGSVPQQNKLTGALGGAASGAALGSAIMPGIGTGIGAVGGALLPFLFK